MSKNWAICIGINDYYNTTKLRYAVQDASAVRDFLKEVEFDEVFYFADDSPPIETPEGLMRSEPTRANLLYFFRKRFQKKFLGVGDNFWFFFAGHGELHQGHDYLMPIDVDPENLDETALKISDITAHIKNSGADNTVLLLDACRNQGRRSATGIGSDVQPGIVTIYACSPQQSSYEVEELQHGSFTYALLEGFRLQGANSCATVQRIDQYLRHEVPKLNRQYKKEPQTPYTAVEPLSKNCLILLPERARLEDVVALKNLALKAEIGRDWDSAEQLWVRVLAASRMDRDAVEAIGRIAVARVQQPAIATSVPLPIAAGSRRIEESVSDAEPLPAPEAPMLAFEVVRVDAKGNVTQRERRSVEYRREQLGQDVVIDMVAIPGGSFLMGSEDSDSEKPQHNVAVKPFFMSKSPVTQSQWRAVAALPKIKLDLNPDPSRFKGINRPIEKVSWDDAVEFCERVSQNSNYRYRLPSEAEWEYACRAGTTTPFYFGEMLTSDLANYDANYTYGSGPKGEYREQTTDVGNFPANGFGLCDMHGNVWEWCQDHWHKNYKGAPTDGSAWLFADENAKRILRGGSWNVNPAYCRSADRHWNAHDIRDSDVGFRVVCFSS